MKTTIYLDIDHPIKRSTLIEKLNNTPTEVAKWCCDLSSKKSDLSSDAVAVSVEHEDDEIADDIAQAAIFDGEVFDPPLQFS